MVRLPTAFLLSMNKEALVFGVLSITVACILVSWLRKSNTSKLKDKVATDVTTTKTEPIIPLENFDWKSQEPNQYRPFKPIYHVTMAVRSDTPSELITIDRDYLDRISLRKQLMTNHGSKTHDCVPGGEDAVQEVYTHLFADYLPQRYPTIFQLTEDKKTIENLVTSETHSTAPPPDVHVALRVMGSMVEEDIFLLKETTQGHRCVAFVCCFPSGWDPASKLGKLMVQIHDGVPSYNKIGPSMERFFSKLEVGRSVKRNNWSVQTHEDLFDVSVNHSKGDDEVGEEEIDVETTFVRVELQTLSRLPRSHSIMFSFKTYLYPIKSIKNEGLGPEVADAIEGLKKGNAPGMWKYKSAVRWGKSACRYLRS